MRRIVLVALSTITAVVLLLSYHTSTNSLASSGPTVQTPPGESSSTPRRSAPAQGAAKDKRGTPKTNAVTYAGEVVSTQWGPVQVRINVRNGRITACNAVQYPNENGHSQEVSSYALPLLSREAIQQQSARIDTVSGATVTSDGYLQSLQSAIDRAHL